MEDIITGQSLKALRSDAGISLRELGRMTGMSLAYLVPIEKSSSRPTVATLSKIFKALGAVPVEQSRLLAEKLAGNRYFCYHGIPDGDHDSPLCLTNEVFSWLEKITSKTQSDILYRDANEAKSDEYIMNRCRLDIYCPSNKTNFATGQST